MLNNSHTKGLWCSRATPTKLPHLHLVSQSKDQGLDVDSSAAATGGGPRSMYSSLSTLGRSQYPTLPLGASTSNGVWAAQFPSLARSPSAGGQSDSVFLDSPDDPSMPPESPGRYCRDPTYSNGSQGELETDGASGFFPPQHLHHSLPRRSHASVQNRALPGEQAPGQIIANPQFKSWQIGLHISL